MQTNNEPCHGVLPCLQTGSRSWFLSPVVRPWQKLTSFIVWHFENLGWRKGLPSLCRGIWSKGTRGRPVVRKPVQPATGEVLALQPGELVEVKSIDEVLATLDPNRRHKGLRWMTGMRKYCGKQYRVYRRVERIMLESNGELRNMKNTVLLEDVMCDGRDFGACDRSCFHFWREAWLRRIAGE